MGIKLEEKIETSIEEKVKSLGFEIEYVENVNEAGNNIIRIVLDKDTGSVSIDDCEKVSRAIEDTIDKMISKEYVLEVSSPGLERQLKNIKLYKKYEGKEVFIKLFKKIDNLKEFTGILEEVNTQDNTIIVRLENEEKLTLNIEQISSAHTTYDFESSITENKVNLNELKKF